MKRMGLLHFNNHDEFLAKFTKKNTHHFCDISQSFIDLLVEWSTQELRHQRTCGFVTPVVGKPQMMRNVEDKKDDI
jgi:hypothetical protein